MLIGNVKEWASWQNEVYLLLCVLIVVMYIYCCYVYLLLSTYS